MQQAARILGPVAASMVALVLLAVVNRQADFVAGFVGGFLQWLLTAIVIVSLIGAGGALGRLWSAHCRFRAAAFVAPLIGTIALASMFLFAQTYSPAGSNAAGSIGLTALVAIPAAAVLAVVAAVGTDARDTYGRSGV